MPRRELIVDPSLYDVTKPIATLEDIRQLNAQRFELEQLTGVLYENFETKSAVGYLQTTENDFWVRGHMPGYPLFPGVLMCEVAAQLTGYLANKYDLMSGSLLGLAGLDDVRFRGVVHPGDLLVVQTRMLYCKKMLVSAEFLELVGTEVVCEGIVKGVPLPKKALG